VKPKQNMLPVTKTFLPSEQAYMAQVGRAFRNGWLTNRGELVLELENALALWLDTPKPLLMTNGTLPIQIALKLLGRGGEIITTPFSYVATTAAIVWEHCKPVFVDIHPEFLTIDESKIEAAITEKTTCILATHVFGNPCNVEAIEQIAGKYDLKVIYDAAHCFGVKYRGNSVFNYGDVSTCSFHATKVFHTGEGGAVFCRDEELMHQMYYSHNFGHNGPLDFFGLGINGKMSELQAAMGLAVLPCLQRIFDGRKQVVEQYNRELNFKSFIKLNLRPGTTWNYSYYPVVFDTAKSLVSVQTALNAQHIFPRRYFFPSLDTLPFIKSPGMPISQSIAERILCLPLYADLDHKMVSLITGIINNH
jgi:dTDP-4-amino-4,6-dideoxygalactose transaminase